MLNISDFRFYVTFFHSKSLSEENILSSIKPILTPLVPEIQLKVKFIDDFPYRQYHKLSVLEIKLGNVDTTKEAKPINVFEISNVIKDLLNKLNDEIFELQFDDMNLYPYALTIASGVNSESNVMWTPDKVNQHKKLLGSWIEYYSGQYEDYSQELYDSRIENNLSNRMSELHFIRNNSAFIYMEKSDPRWVGWMEYMEEYFVDQILRARSILYALMILNKELDDVSDRIRDLPPGAIKTIEKELKFVEELRLLVVDITGKLSREKLMNRLNHSTKVVNECFRIFAIDNAYHLVDDKIAQLHTTLEKEQRNVQMQLQNQQKRWILILNALIGYQVAFDVLDQAADYFNFQDSLLYDIITATIWLILISMVGFVVGGFIWSFIRSRKGLKK